MVSIPEEVDQPVTLFDGVSDGVVQVLARLNRSDQTKLAGQYITFLKLRQPNQWLVQHDEEWLGQLLSVHVVEPGSVRTVSVMHVKYSEPWDPCHVAVNVCQVSGTCYFNTAINQLCLGNQLARLTLDAVHAQVALCTEAQQKSFFRDPLDLTVCPAQFTRLDVLRLLYALVCPASPTKLAAGIFGTKPQYNVTAEAIYAVGHRRRAANNAGTADVGSAGGDPAAALADLMKMLGIRAYIHIGLLPMVGHHKDDVDVLLYGASERTVRHNGHLYDLDTCAVTVYTDGEAHSMTGFICEGTGMVCESNTGAVVPFDWLRWLRRHVTAPRKTAKAFSDVWLDTAQRLGLQEGLPFERVTSLDLMYGVYVKRAAESPAAKRQRVA